MTHLQVQHHDILSRKRTEDSQLQINQANINHTNITCLINPSSFAAYRSSITVALPVNVSEQPIVASATWFQRNGTQSYSTPSSVDDLQYLLYVRLTFLMFAKSSVPEFRLPLFPVISSPSQPLSVFSHDHQPMIARGITQCNVVLRDRV